MTVAEVLIRRAQLFGTEQEGDMSPRAAAGESCAPILQSTQRMLQLAMAHGRGANDQRSSPLLLPRRS